MRFVGLSLAVVLFAASAVAQDESVMIDDLTTTEVQAAIDAGTTTAIYYVGGTHQNGAAVVLGKHNLLARHLSQRVAEELGNARGGPRNSDRLLRWDPDHREGVWNVPKETELPG